MPRFRVTVENVISTHSRVIAASGGEDGVLSYPKLEAAVARPYTAVFGKVLFPTYYDKAGVLFHSIAMSHAFVDGNKRTAGAVASNFLEVHSRFLELTDEQVIAFALHVVRNRIDEREIADFLRQHCRHTLR